PSIICWRRKGNPWRRLARSARQRILSSSVISRRSSRARCTFTASALPPITIPRGSGWALRRPLSQPAAGTGREADLSPGPSPTRGGENAGSPFPRREGGWGGGAARSLSLIQHPAFPEGGSQHRADEIAPALDLLRSGHHDVLRGWQITQC